jgi:predicted DNA-binding ArsR family transcriptional regulator
LKDLKKHFDSIVFVSYLTVQPDKDSVNEYVNKMKQELEDDTTQLWYIGRMVEHIDTNILSSSMLVFNSIDSLVTVIK